MKDTVIFLKKNNYSSLDQSPPLIEGLSPMVQKLIREYQNNWLNSQVKGEVATIHIDEIASKVALFYEAIRRIVDWKEEHLVRRAAIERILKRRMISEISGLKLTPNLRAEEIAEPLVLELIRSGHLPNDQIPQKKIAEVQQVIEKYVYFLHHSPQFNNNVSSQIKKKINFYHWILEIAACEIEELLSPPLKENALIDCMTDLMMEGIRVEPSGALSDEEKKVQIYIAVHRALFHLDAPIISYHLLKYHYPQWANLPDSLLEKIGKNIFSIWKKLEEDLLHPLSGEFYKICEKYDTLYLILGDILENFSDNPSVIPEKISQPKALENLIKEAYNKRLSTLKSRLFRAAVYSTLSIFIASGFSLFLVEVPLARLFYGRFNLVAMIVDIIVPSLLMFLLVAMIKPPAETNRERVIEEIKKIVFPGEKKDIYQIKIRSKKWSIIRLFIGILYFLASFLSLGIIIAIFYLARIPTTSIIIDTMNVAVIVFAGLIIKQRSRELTVEEKTSFGEFSLDILSVPVARLGQWLSSKWKEYNLVSVFFIALVDMPFLAFIEFVENWSLFLKEKKAEIH